MRPGEGRRNLRAETGGEEGFPTGALFGKAYKGSNGTPAHEGLTAAFGWARKVVRQVHYRFCGEDF